MKFMGWVPGQWSNEDDGPSSKWRKMRSANRQKMRRIAKKRARLKAKRNLNNGGEN